MTEIKVPNKEPTPIDNVVLDQINQCHQQDFGFVLNLAKSMEGNELKIRVEPTLPPVDDYVPPRKDRFHAFNDHMSLIEYAKTYGSPDKSVVFYDDEGIELILDEKIDQGHREILGLDFQLSDVWSKWESLLSGRRTHKELRKELVYVRHTMFSADLLQALRTVKYNEEVRHESEIKEDGDAFYGVSFSVSGVGDTIKKIPRSLKFTAPVLDIDTLETEKWPTVDVNLEVIMPTKPDESMYILLVAPAFADAKRRRIHSLMDDVRASLNGWLICNGASHYQDKPVGNSGRFRIGWQTPLGRTGR